MNYAAKVALVSLNDIDFGDRFRDDYGDLAQLMLSIETEGLIQPLAIMENEEKDGKPYTLLAGGRRFKALTALVEKGKFNGDSIPTRVYPPLQSELEIRSIELAENLQRKDLSFVEELQLKDAIHNLQISIHGQKLSTAKDAPGWSMEDTANLLGVSKATVSQDLKLAEAINTFPELAKCKNKSEASKLLNKIEEDAIAAEISKRIKTNSKAVPEQKLNLINSYMNLDCFEGMKGIDSGLIHIAEVDPPYGIDLMDLKQVDTTQTQIDREKYNEVPKIDYPLFLVGLAESLYRVMAQHSWVIFWHSYDWAEETKSALEYAGFSVHHIPGIWHKDSGQTQCNHPEMYLGNGHERFFYARKGNAMIVKQGRNNIYSYKPVPAQSKIHPTERPIEMIQDVLSTFAMSGMRGLVPFLGSGNSLLAMSNIGITGFGYDLTAEYKDRFTLRVMEGTYSDYHSY